MMRRRWLAWSFAIYLALVTLLTALGVVIWAEFLPSMKGTSVSLVLTWGALVSATLMGPICVVAAVWSRGVLRGFNLGGLLGAMSLGSVALMLLTMYGGSVIFNWINQSESMSFSIADSTPSLLIFHVHWNIIMVVGGLLGALLVWAARGPQQGQGMQQYRSSRRWRLWLAAATFAGGFAGLRFLPISVQITLLIMCGCIVLPAFALGGVICGRPRLKAACLAWIPLWIAWPWTGTLGFQTIAQSMAIGQVTGGASEWKSFSLMMQMVLVAFGASSGFVWWLHGSLRRHRSAYRRSNDMTGATACCGPQCCACQSSLFPTPCVCDGDCGP